MSPPHSLSLPAEAWSPLGAGLKLETSHSFFGVDLDLLFSPKWFSRLMNGGLCIDYETWADWATCHNLVSTYVLECTQGKAMKSGEIWVNRPRHRRHRLKRVTRGVGVRQ